MAITAVGAGSSGNGNGNGITGITRPTTTTDDVFILDLYVESGGTSEATVAVTFSNGTWVKETYVLQDGPGGAGRFAHGRYRSRYAGEGSTFNITWSVIGAVWRTVTLSAYRGVHTTTPDDAAATAQASATATVTITGPSLTPVTNASMIVWSSTDFNGDARTVPAGTTPTFSNRIFFGTNHIADGILTTAAATGAKTSTLDGAQWNTGALAALRDATPAATTAPPPFRQPLAALLGR